MDFKTLLALLSIAMALTSHGLYVRSVLQGKTRPHAFTWGIWALAMAVVYAAQYTEGAGPGAWIQAVTAVVCTGVTLLALKRGDRSYTKTDWIALAFALSSIPLWIATGTPLWSVILLCAIDAAGFYPTFRKSWHKPREEPALPYAVWAVADIASILAMDVYSATTVLYPAFLAGINFVFIAMLAIRRKA